MTVNAWLAFKNKVFISLRLMKAISLHYFTVKLYGSIL